MRFPAFAGTSASCSRKRALTLIELLVVMAIMTILAGAITVAAMGAYRRAQEKATGALFERIAQALEQYKSDYRMYVPADLDTSTYPLWQGLEYEGHYFSEESRYKAKGSSCEDPATGSQVPRYQYQDAWRNLITYQCNAPYNRFRLTSNGKDLVPGNGDDIVKE